MHYIHNAHHSICRLLTTAHVMETTYTYRNKLLAGAHFTLPIDCKIFNNSYTYLDNQTTLFLDPAKDNDDNLLGFPGISYSYQSHCSEYRGDHCLDGQGI